MRSCQWYVLATALFWVCCGGSNAAPATAETADEPADMEPGDTAFGSEEEPAAPTEESGDGAEEAAPADGESESEAADDAEEEAAAEPAADPNAPPPSGDLQSYVGTGGTTPEYRTVTENMDLIKRCYLDALRQNEDLQGNMILQFTVNKKGKVIKAKAIDNELTPQVAKCVVKTVKKIKFPARVDKRTVEYPFKFFPSPSN